MDVLDLGTPSSSKGHASSHLEPKKRVKRIISSSVPPEMAAKIQANKDQILQVINLILENNAPLPHSIEWYYSNIERLCRYKPMEQSLISSEIFSKLKTYYFSLVHNELESSILSNDPQQFLDIYDSWVEILHQMTKVFLYIDRSYLKSHNSKSMIFDYGITMIIDDLLQNKDLRNKLIFMGSHVLNKARASGFNSNHMALAHNLISILVKLNHNNQLKIKEIWLENSVNSHIKIMREVEPALYYETCDFYVNKDVEFILEVKESPKTAQSFKSKVIWQWFFKDFNSVLQKILPYLNKTQLKDLFNLTQDADKEYSIDASAQYYYEWGVHVQNRITSEIIPLASSKDTMLIDKIAQLFHSLNFEINTKFEFESRNGFSKAFLKPELNQVIIQQLCRYCDIYFKLKVTDHTLENAILIFKLIPNKHAFLVGYKRDLSRRLLFNKSAAKFAQECEFVEQICSIVGHDDEGLKKMLEEIQLKPEFMYSGTKFTPLILSSKNWPEFPKSLSEDINLPKPLQGIMNQYLINNLDSQRKYDWSLYSFHQLVISVNFPSGSKDVMVNLLQAAILLLFNDEDFLSIEQVQEKLNISQRTAIAGLVSLNEKYEILKRNDSSTYSFNPNFNDKSAAKILKIPPSKVIKEAAKLAVLETDARKLARNRQSEIRALIVRVLKSRQSINMEELITIAFGNLQQTGPVTVSDVKKEIECLINQEYLKRGNGQSIEYIP